MQIVQVERNFPNGKGGVRLEVVHKFQTEFPENHLTIWPQIEISWFFWFNDKHSEPAILQIYKYQHDLETEMFIATSYLPL